MVANEVWTVTIAGNAFTYTAGSTQPQSSTADPLTMVTVAKRLADLVNAALKDTSNTTNTRYAAEDADPDPIIFGINDTGDRYTSSAVVESLVDPAVAAAANLTLNPTAGEIFEGSILNGGKTNNILVVNDADNSILVGTTAMTVTNWTGAVRLDAKGGGSLNELLHS